MNTVFKDGAVVFFAFFNLFFLQKRFYKLYPLPIQWNIFCFVSIMIQLDSWRDIHLIYIVMKKFQIKSIRSSAIYSWYFWHVEHISSHFNSFLVILFYSNCFESFFVGEYDCHSPITFYLNVFNFSTYFPFQASAFGQLIWIQRPK